MLEASKLYYGKTQLSGLSYRSQAEPPMKAPHEKVTFTPVRDTDSHPNDIHNDDLTDINDGRARHAGRQEG